MEGEEYKDSWRRLPSTPRAHHILREADVHTVSSRQGVTQAVTEMHMGEEILMSTKALEGFTGRQHLSWSLKNQTGPAT